MIQAIYASPLQRALYTAQAIARHHQLEVQTDPSLKEIDAGELEGLPLDELRSYLSELIADKYEDEEISRRYGGETAAKVQERAWSTIQSIIGKHHDGVIVIVSHYFVILTVICFVLNLPVSEMGRLKLGVGSISTIVFEERGPRLTLFNDDCHLPNK